MELELEASDRINARQSSRKNNKEYLDSQEWAGDSEILQTLLSELTLRMNPTEREAQSLLKAAKKLDQAARIHSSPAVILANEVMIRHAQWVLKAEWERVKQEASGPVCIPFYWWRNWRRSRAYADFLKNDGSLKKLDLIGAGTGDANLTRARSAMDSERL